LAKKEEKVNNSLQEGEMLEVLHCIDVQMFALTAVSKRI